MSFTSSIEALSLLTKAAMDFMGSPENDIHLPGTREPAFDLPVLAFAAGDDPFWEKCKEYVGPFHWTPMEAFLLAFPDAELSPGELSVMSWILPQTEKTCKDHRKQKNMPAERWVRSRIFGEQLVNDGLCRHLLGVLDSHNIPALSPHFLPAWKRMPSPRYEIASMWSERHAAYAAGLGTFGLCDGLITAKGKAVRFGSIIMRQRMPVAERPYSDHREYCLFFNSGACDACIRRCPVGAISPEGHDKIKCQAFLDGVTKAYVKATWNFDGFGCGLCQVGVPCEKGIPRKRIACSEKGELSLS